MVSCQAVWGLDHRTAKSKTPVKVREALKLQLPPRRPSEPPWGAAGAARLSRGARPALPAEGPWGPRSRGG